MPAKEEYEAAIKVLGWPGLRQIWEGIKIGDTPWWEAGKAFEYLVLRMFDLDGSEVRWPFGVSILEGPEVEQIDGSVRFGSLYALVESKDHQENIPIAPIAKLRNQLLRRPGGTIRFVFSSRGFTSSAAQLAHFALPQAILLWTGDEVAKALAQERICEYAQQKYRFCVDEGMPDYNVA